MIFFVKQNKSKKASIETIIRKLNNTNYFIIEYSKKFKVVLEIMKQSHKTLNESITYNSEKFKHVENSVVLILVFLF